MKLLLLILMTLTASNVFAESDPIWIIEPKDVLNASEPVLVLDARESLIKFRDKNAVAVKWQEFSGKGVNAGTLLPIDQLAKKLEAIGVRNDTPIAVFGDGANGWGADGRIVWMLRALGHERTYWVQGGLADLKHAGWPGQIEFSKKAGDFTPKLNAELVATTDDVLAAIQSDTTLFDTREKREFKGKTPYGEKRGGHVPTSVHMHFSALFDSKGLVKSKEDVLAMIRKAGQDPDAPTIGYCTGGVRSAMFVVILRHYGIDAKNYAGSMWLWASLPESDHPLIR